MLRAFRLPSGAHGKTNGKVFGARMAGKRAFFRTVAACRSGSRGPKMEHEGSVLIVCVVMLILMSVIGIAATTTAVIELRIAGNERVYARNFYLAESAVMEGAQRMQNISDPIRNPPVWLETDLGSVADVDVCEDIFWECENSSTAECGLSGARFFAVSQGIASGSSLDASRSRVHAFAIYGRCGVNNGNAIIKAGYRKAF